MKSARLEQLRGALAASDIAAFILRDIDPHQSEVPAEHFRVRSWASGFTGSAGTLILGMKAAAFWTDSRYVAEARQLLRNSPVEFQTLTGEYDKGMFSWLTDHITEGSRIAFYYPSMNTMEEWQKRLPQYTFVEAAPIVDATWRERPPLLHRPVFSYWQYAHQPLSAKISMIREHLASRDCTHHLVSSLDDVAWILNLRGLDLEHTPVFFSHLLISETDLYLFMDLNALNTECSNYLRAEGVTLYPYGELQKVLQNLKDTAIFMLDPDRISHCFTEDMSASVCKVEQPSQAAKAIKTDTEAAVIHRAHRIEGCVLVELLQWIYRTAASGTLSERVIAERCSMLRGKQQHYCMDSFSSIVAFRGHSAFPHYRPDDTLIMGGGLLLIDTGGHYLYGSTDTTRCIYLGDSAPEAVMRDYTLVLKSHIALCRARFPVGTTGIQLDAIVRNQLWQEGINYGHGTGHGIGNLLEVHEYPPALGPNSSYNVVLTPLEPGMMLSNEPGLYREGHYGIRIENILRVRRDCSNEFGKFLSFENFTLCPLERRLILTSLCTAEELEWINCYHEHVYSELSGLLPDDQRTWLKMTTARIS